VTVRPFVVVSGLPGSGKTTLARQLAPFLELPLVDKDDILDGLFESKGVGDAAWRRALSRESDALLRSRAVESAGAVLVSFWHVPGMAPDSGTPVDWVRDLTDTIVHVRCNCTPEVAAERFLRRTRHAGHLDADTDGDSVRTNLIALATLEPLEPLDLGERVDVDTSGLVHADNVARDVRNALTRRMVTNAT
jgi:predicted kinase